MNNELPDKGPGNSDQGSKAHFARGLGQADGIIAYQTGGGIPGASRDELRGY